MKIKNEAKIGMMITITLVLLGVLTIKTGKFSFSVDGYVIKAHFKNVDGVNLNSPVMFNGFEVGIVEDIVIKEDMDDIKMELTLWIDQKARLREGAKAYIKNLGFMGEKYIGLTSGDKGGAYLPPGSIVQGQEPADFERLLSDGQEITKKLKSISEKVDERLEVNKDKMDETLTNLNIVMKDLTTLVQSANLRLSTNEKKIDDTVTNLHDLSVNLEEMSYDLKLNPWKIMYRGKERRGEKQEEK